MRVLRFSSRGPAVQLLQTALNRAGFGPLKTDGVFGAATRDALIRFQAANDLTADGVAGVQSHRALLPWYTGYRLHVLQPGESYWSLSRRYGSSAESIALANPGLPPEKLPVGAALVVPLPFPVVPTEIDYCAALVGYCVQGLSARYPFLRSGQFGRSALCRPLWSLTLGQGTDEVAVPVVARLVVHMIRVSARGHAFQRIRSEPKHVIRHERHKHAEDR